MSAFLLSPSRSAVPPSFFTRLFNVDSLDKAQTVIEEAGELKTRSNLLALTP